MSRWMQGDQDEKQYINLGSTYAWEAGRSSFLESKAKARRMLVWVVFYVCVRVCVFAMRACVCVCVRTRVTIHHCSSQPSITENQRVRKQRLCSGMLVRRLSVSRGMLRMLLPASYWCEDKLWNVSPCKMKRAPSVGTLLPPPYSCLSPSPTYQGGDWGIARWIRGKKFH